MKAMQLNASNQEPLLIQAEVPQPQPGKGELLIRVQAAGVTPTELHWYPTTHTKSGEVRHKAIPGHEYSGVIAAIGEQAAGFAVGQSVYGMNDWFAEGATAEYCIAQPQSIAPKPASLAHEAAATVPIGALTAWQALIDRAKVQRDDRVLVHGGAGSVGSFAVQLAKLHGAYAIATVSSDDREFVTQLGADEALDYEASRFEERVHHVDVVFDTVGGQTLARSWGVLKPGGKLITIAADSEGTTDPRIKDAFFIVEPNRRQLVEIAKLLDAGKLKTFVNAVVPFPQASAAYSGSAKQKRRHGKVVITI
jgi:NADPH:quinone reductase-like Zn-dependent oxidoreductase